MGPWLRSHFRHDLLVLVALARSLNLYQTPYVVCAAGLQHRLVKDQHPFQLVGWLMVQYSIPRVISGCAPLPSIVNVGAFCKVRRHRDRSISRWSVLTSPGTMLEKVPMMNSGLGALLVPPSVSKMESSLSAALT